MFESSYHHQIFQLLLSTTLECPPSGCCTTENQSYTSWFNTIPTFILSHSPFCSFLFILWILSFTKCDNFSFKCFLQYKVTGDSVNKCVRFKKGDVLDILKTTMEVWLTWWSNCAARISMVHADKLGWYSAKAEKFSSTLKNKSDIGIGA